MKILLLMKAFVCFLFVLRMLIKLLNRKYGVLTTLLALVISIITVPVCNPIAYSLVCCLCNICVCSSSLNRKRVIREVTEGEEMYYRSAGCNL